MGYSTSTAAPKASRVFWIFSASSLGTFALRICGHDSTNFFACERKQCLRQILITKQFKIYLNQVHSIDQCLDFFDERNFLSFIEL